MTQLAVDLVSAKLIDRVGYRRCVTFAHLLTAVGLLSLSVLPSLLPDPYAGLICSVVLYAAGSGLIEVLVSPIIEACPAPNKHSLMSLMHSFYCFGTVAVVLISTLALARDRRYMGAAPARECAVFLARSDIQHDRGARQYAGKAAAVYAAVLGAAYAHVCRRCM